MRRFVLHLSRHQGAYALFCLVSLVAFWLPFGRSFWLLVTQPAGRVDSFGHFLVSMIVLMPVWFLNDQVMSLRDQRKRYERMSPEEQILNDRLHEMLLEIFRTWTFNRYSHGVVGTVGAMECSMRLNAPDRGQLATVEVWKEKTSDLLTVIVLEDEEWHGLRDQLASRREFQRVQENRQRLDALDQVTRWKAR